MTNSQPHIPPSPRQLRALRNLANATGQTFAYPRTGGEASEEITRLKKVAPTSRSDRRRELKSVRGAMATGRGDASRIRDDELQGYGSTAAWREGVEDEEKGNRE